MEIAILVATANFFLFAPVVFKVKETDQSAGEEKTGVQETGAHYGGQGRRTKTPLCDLWKN